MAAVANRVRDVVLRGTEPLDADARALVAGFLLGDTRAIPDAIAEDYRASGLSHLLAVSGANVAFVLLVFAPLLRRLLLVPRTGVAIVIVVVFAAATRFEPSVLRASVLATVTILTSFVGRPVSRVRALALAIVVLLYQHDLEELRLYRVGEGLLVIAAGLTIWSGLQYVRAAWPILRQQR